MSNRRKQRREEARKKAEQAAAAAAAAPPPDPVVAHIHSIVALWAAGDTFATIVQNLELPLTASELRARIMMDVELRDRLDEHHKARAAALIDKATQAAQEATATGDPAGLIGGAKIMMTLAEKLDREKWGAVKAVELSGKNGKPIEVKADMSLSPAEAYERMVRGQ